MKVALVLSLVVASFACSSKKESSTGSGSSSGSSAASGSAPVGSAEPGSGSGSAVGSGSDDGSGSATADSGDDFDFDKLSDEDKQDFMKKKVVPVMRTAFQKFNAKKFAKFSCKTCHGKDPKASKYKMPNSELPKLDWAALKAGKDAKIKEFMDNTVKPEMARILHQPEYDDATGKGFGCLECHEEKK